MEDTRPTGAAGSKRYVPGLFSAVRRKGRGGEETYLGPLLLLGRRLADTRPIGATGVLLLPSKKRGVGLPASVGGSYCSATRCPHALCWCCPWTEPMGCCRTRWGNRARNQVFSWASPSWPFGKKEHALLSFLPTSFLPSFVPYLYSPPG